MKSFLRRCLALVLVLAMSISGGIEAFAASDVFEGFVLNTEDAVVANPSGDYELLPNELENSIKEFSGAKINEEVTFIVELEGESVLEAKSDSQTAAEYMTSFAGNKTLNSIEDEQETVKDRIKFDGNYDLKVEFTYNVVMNGLAVSGPYAAKEYLESLPGVKGVYVANTYDVPEISNEANYASITSGGMINSDISNDNGYTGKGTVTAVLDTGLDINHGAFANAPENPAFDLSDIEEAVESGYLLAGSVAVAEDLYVSEKVPFAFNYADGVADVTDNEQHGTHVSGTIGANCDDFKGVAPDTQIVMMKVFGDTQGASDAVIFAALQDAVILGVDAINMSLGAPGGFTYENEITEYYYGAVKAAGINLMCSAGNENNSVENTNGLSALYYSNFKAYIAANPDNGIVGSPSTYDAALSVASVNEYQDFVSYILAGERQISFNDANMETALDFVNFFDGQTLEYVVIPGYGAPEDYEGLDVEGKLALVMRGVLDFTAKEANAAAAGAAGMIVYNNQPGDRIYMVNNGLIPEIFISMEDGQYLIEQENKTISVSVDYNDFANTSDGGLMSSFSSIGPAPDLSIKPEITAPGGYVYSTLPGGGFGSMSGTSMAAPHMAGAAAVMQQYMDAEFSTLSEPEKRELINTLLMNTAVPVKENVFGIPIEYPVRKQGAGLANVNNAINTGAYVTVDGCERPKAELGDSEDGVYTIDLTVHNFSDKELTYNMDAVSLVSYAEFDGYNFGMNIMYEYQVYTEMISEEGMIVEFDKDTVTVPAGGAVSVSVKLSTSEGLEDYINEYFENGTFLEGYIKLESADVDGIDLSVPYLGFYGDWGEAPIFDTTLYDGIYNVYPTSVVGLVPGEGYLYLGANAFDKENLTTPDYDKISIGAYMVNAGFYPCFDAGLLRAPKTISYNVTDANGEKLDIYALYDYYGQIVIANYGQDSVHENVIKSFYYSNGGFVNSDNGPTYYGWLPIDADYYFLPEGQYYLNATATVDGTDSPAGTQEFSLPIYLDYTAPQLLATKYIEQDGNEYLLAAVYDDRYMMGAQLVSADGEYAYSPIEMFDEDEKGVVSIVAFNVTGAEEAGITTASLYLADYALNEVLSYEFVIKEDTLQPNGIDVVDSVAFVKGGESFIVEAYITPEAGFGTEDTITWTSSDERTATVEALDETRYDEETGITYYRARVTTKPRAHGQVVITATAQNGASDSTIINVGVYGPNVPSDPSGPSEPTVPSKPNDGCDHEWSDWKNEDGMMKRTCSECGITEFVPAEKTEDESNPNTGAPVSNVFGAMVVVAGAAIALKKIRK